MKKKCKHCNEEFSKKTHQSRKRFDKQLYCSSACVRRARLARNKGFSNENDFLFIDRRDYHSEDLIDTILRKYS